MIVDGHSGRADTRRGAMPFNLPLSPRLSKGGWKVKIRDKEGPEMPHVSILRGTQTWRVSLRSGRFMDRKPNRAEVPEELLVHIDKNWDRLCAEWDERYPNNPVQGDEE